MFDLRSHHILVYVSPSNIAHPDDIKRGYGFRCLLFKSAFNDPIPIVESNTFRNIYD